MFGVLPNRTGRRPAPRRALFAGWIALWVGVSLVTVELVSREWLAVPAAVGRHPVQPYLMHGNVYGYGLVSDQPMLDREGPSVYAPNRRDKGFPALY